MRPNSIELEERAIAHFCYGHNALMDELATRLEIPVEVVRRASVWAWPGLATVGFYEGPSTEMLWQPQEGSDQAALSLDRFHQLFPNCANNPCRRLQLRRI